MTLYVYTVFINWKYIYIYYVGEICRLYIDNLLHRTRCEQIKEMHMTFFNITDSL